MRYEVLRQVGAVTFAVVATGCAERVALPTLDATVVANATDALEWRPTDGVGTTRALLPLSGSSPALVWNGSEADAWATAQRRHLPLVACICADWSVGCLEMPRALWNRPRVIQAVANAVLLYVDLTEDSPSNDARLQRFGVSGVPSVVVIDPSGSVERMDGRDADAVERALIRLLAR